MEGLTTAHLRFMLASQLHHLDHLDGMIALFDAEIERRMALFAAALTRIDGIPGIGTRVGQEILAEIGVGMTKFPTAGHLASWARMCPGMEKSGGKRRAAGIGSGNRYLKGALTEAAWAASRTKDTYLRSRYWRMVSTMGQKRAVVAVGHSILRICYFLLGDGGTYQDLSPNYLEQRDRDRATKSAVRRLERLGYHVALSEAA